MSLSSHTDVLPSFVTEFRGLQGHKSVEEATLPPFYRVFITEFRGLARLLLL